MVGVRACEMRVDINVRRTVNYILEKHATSRTTLNNVGAVRKFPLTVSLVATTNEHLQPSMWHLVLTLIVVSTQLVTATAAHCAVVHELTQTALTTRRLLVADTPHSFTAILEPYLMQVCSDSRN